MNKHASQPYVITYADVQNGGFYTQRFHTQNHADLILQQLTSPDSGYMVDSYKLRGVELPFANCGDHKLGYIITIVIREQMYYLKNTGITSTLSDAHKYTRYTDARHDIDVLSLPLNIVSIRAISEWW